MANCGRMGLALIFVLGILNIAANRAVIDSGHPVVETLPAAFRRKGGKLSLAAEVCVLIAAMAFLSAGAAAAGWFYAVYSAGTLFAAWAILTGRI